MKARLIRALVKPFPSVSEGFLAVPPAAVSVKPGLRSQFRAARDALGPRVRGEAAAAIAAKVVALAPYQDARRALFYATFGSEVDTAPLMAAAVASGREIILPRMDGRNLSLHRHRPGDPLVPNRLGIPEPSPAAPVVTLDAADLVLVPGLAFDRRGHRLGYGGGYYDRMLRTSPHAYRLGLAYQLQIVETLPALGHDEALDAVVTDADIFLFKRRHH